jgi:peptidoglycan LD-endopeptidase LytH
MTPLRRRRWPWVLCLVLVASLPWASWPARHVRLLWNALEYRAEPRVMEVPVDGLAPKQLASTWHAPRSGGRRHEGADLFAKKGTSVVSAVNGHVWRVGDDRLGGNVVWVLGEGHTLYYYAHLDRFADGLEVGQQVSRGDVLGFVGNTGNARTTPPHLHFGMYRVGWRGIRAVDPVPRLQRLAAREKRSGRELLNEPGAADLPERGALMGRAQAQPVHVVHLERDDDEGVRRRFEGHRLERLDEPTPRGRPEERRAVGRRQPRPG